MCNNFTSAVKQLLLHLTAKFGMNYCKEQIQPITEVNVWADGIMSRTFTAHWHWMPNTSIVEWKFAALYRYLWRLHMSSENFLRKTIKNQQTRNLDSDQTRKQNTTSILPIFCAYLKFCFRSWYLCKTYENLIDTKLKLCWKNKTKCVLIVMKTWIKKWNLNNTPTLWPSTEFCALNY